VNDFETVREALRHMPDTIELGQEADAALDRIEAEVERLRAIRDLLVQSVVRATGADEDAVREAPLTCAIRHAEEVERLLKELDRMTGEARKWHDRAEENAIKCEKLLRRVEYLESEDA
jgi:hypothetical protein